MEWPVARQATWAAQSLPRWGLTVPLQANKLHSRTSENRKDALAISWRGRLSLGRLSDIGIASTTAPNCPAAAKHFPAKAPSSSPSQSEIHISRHLSATKRSISLYYSQISVIANHLQTGRMTRYRQRAYGTDPAACSQMLHCRRDAQPDWRGRLPRPREASGRCRGR